MAPPSLHSRAASARQRQLALAPSSTGRFLLLAAVSAVAPRLVAADPSLSDLKQLSVEELMDIQVTSVSRHPETLFDAASAIQVIDGQDIERSGATSLPEALRLAPNLSVAQSSAENWAISARGFDGAPFPFTSLSDKLLVMIDGRSIYTPLFAGVFWNVQSVLLEDVDRIEVISGPGGTQWGSNAVNGVINVVSKDARDTQGSYLAAGAGSFVRDFGAARYGGRAGDDLYYRVYVQRLDQRASRRSDGSDAHDSGDITQAGFRTDYQHSDSSHLTIQGDVYRGGFDQPGTTTIRTTAEGEDLIARWTRSFSGESDLTVQAYFDRTWRDIEASSRFTEELLTWDLDTVYRTPLGHRQTLTAGAGYRYMIDTARNSATQVYDPARRTMPLISAFLQDEVVLLPDTLKLTIGAKAEHNVYSGWELQPSGRLAWTFSPRNTFWAAISRAVRSPTRIDADVVVPLAGDPNFDSEDLVAYEIGWRTRPTDNVSASLTGYFHDYHELRALAYPPFEFINGQDAHSWGVELAAAWQATDRWRLRASYTWQDSSFTPTNPRTLQGNDVFEAVDPEHQVRLTSLLDLPGGFQFDLTGRYVSALPASEIVVLPGAVIRLAPRIEDYVTFDARLAWRRGPWEIAVTGRNLMRPLQAEFGTLQIPRSVYGQVTLRW